MGVDIPFLKGKVSCTIEHSKYGLKARPKRNKDPPNTLKGFQ